MLNMYFKPENLEITEQAMQEINDELLISVAEFGTKSWGDFEGGSITKDTKGNYSLSFPNSKRNWTNKEDFITLFASKVTSGNALISFSGTTIAEGATTYQIISEDGEVNVYKFEYQAVLTQETPIITNSIYTLEIIPPTFDTTLNAGDNAIDNVSLAGVGTIEFNNLNVSNNPDDPITDNKNAVIKIGTTDVAQVTFTTSYLNQQFRFIKDGVSYLGTFTETSITVIEE